MGDAAVEDDDASNWWPRVAIAATRSSTPLWPRGVPKARLRLDDWAKDVAPSAALRRWFGHDPARFEEFRQRYLQELSAQEDKLRELRERAREKTLTLVYGARDTEHNDAVVLAELLRGATGEP